MSSLNTRPLITFFLMGYNQEKYIREAIRGAFSQTYTPLEIILSDDCSTDRTFEIMREMSAIYEGPATVILNRTARNLGIAGHVDAVLPMTHGEYIILAGGDDISFPNRADVVTDIFLRDSRTLCVVSNFSSLEMSTKLIPYQWRFDPKTLDLDIALWRGSASVCGAAAAYSRVLFDTFGNIGNPFATEDSVYSLRALLMGTIAFEEQELLMRRRVPGSAGITGLGLDEDIPSMRLSKRKGIGYRIAAREVFRRDLVVAETIGLVGERRAHHLSGIVKRAQRIDRANLLFHSSSYLVRVLGASFLVVLGDLGGSRRLWARIGRLIRTVLPVLRNQR